MVELHGNTTYARCLGCGKRFDLEAIRIAFDRTGDAPPCDACGGLVKTGTISFGQPLPPDASERARDAAATCDLFLAIGSSLVVYPAASLPPLAKRCGASRGGGGSRSRRRSRRRTRTAGTAPSPSSSDAARSRRW